MLEGLAYSMEGKKIRTLSMTYPKINFRWRKVLKINI